MHRHGKRIGVLLTLLGMVMMTVYSMHTAIYTDSSQDRKARVSLEEQTSGFLSQTVLALNQAGSTLPEEYVTKIREAREINSDVHGWVTIEDFGIDYPVLYSEDNKEYLRKNIYGEYDVSGCIYLDASYGDIYSPMKLLHGHNMKNGSMFANLPQMLWWDSLDEAPLITYCDDLGLKVFKIFSVFSVDSTKETLVISQYTTLDELLELKNSYVEKSWSKVSELPSGSEMLMLNTCWYGLSGGQHNLHCIVVAGRVS